MYIVSMWHPDVEEPGVIGKIRVPVTDDLLRNMQAFSWPDPWNGFSGVAGVIGAGGSAGFTSGVAAGTTCTENCSACWSTDEQAN